MKVISEIIKKRFSYQTFLIILIALFIVAIFASSLYRSFNHDEFEAIHSAWKISTGEKIYVDFFQHHNFLLYNILSWVIMIFGSSVTAIVMSRMLIFTMAMAIFWLTYKIAQMAYGKNVALWSLFFLSTTAMFFQKVIEVRPDVPLVLFELLTIFFLMKYFEIKKRTYLFLSAASLFVAFLFLQKAVFLIILLGIFLIFKIYKKQFKFWDFLLYFGTLGIFLGFFVLYLLVFNSFSEYIFLGWLLNTKLLNTFPLYKYLLISIEQNPLTWILYFFGILIMIRKKTFDMLAFISLGLLAFIFLTKSPFPQYYLMSLPFVVMIASLFADKIFEKKKFIMIFIMIISIIYPSYALFENINKDNNKEQLQKIDYVLSITNPSDYIYDGDANFNIFRKDIDYFWFSVKPKTGNLTAYRLMKNYDYDVYKLIDELKPKVVSDSFIKTKNKEIADFYLRSEAFKDLYIRK